MVTKRSGGEFREQSTEALVREIIKSLRENPEKYKKVRDSLRCAKSEEERVERLLTLATSERELAALIPLRAGGVEVAAWTTVTVTTVFILEDSAY